MQPSNKSGKCFPDKKADKVINEITERGNKAEIQRKGNGIVIFEVIRKIRYST